MTDNVYMLRDIVKIGAGAVSRASVIECVLRLRANEMPVRPNASQRQHDIIKLRLVRRRKKDNV
jgi:hypothetical protein